MKFLKILSVLIAALLLLGGCSSDSTSSSPSDVQNGSDGEQSKVINLLYSAHDSLSPYDASSLLNRQLSLLLYDSLVKLDASFQPQLVLAKNIDVIGKDCTVTLKNTSFSDGSIVTANDVVYSFNLAKNSNTIYSKQLSTANACTADGDFTVKFKLIKADPYFANLLDFPIIKAESDKRQDENKISLPPIGSGRYVFDNENKLLTANKAYIGGTLGVETINLINAPDSEVINYNLEVGNVSIYSTDMSEGVIPPMTGTAIPTPLNNLLYLGINLNKSVLKSAEMRYALAYAIDRADIAANAYYSYAVPAKGLFNASFEDAGNLQSLPEKQDLQNIVANLELLGYNSKDADGFFVNSKGKRLSLKLVAFKGNERRLKAAELLKQQLESVGFEINLVALDWDKYTEALTYGNFDLYLAETKLLNNMDVTELITSSGAIAYGIPKVTVSEQPGTESEDEQSGEQETTPTVQSAVPLIDNAVKGFYGEKLSLVDIINAFNAEMPIIPIAHRCGITVYDSTLCNNYQSSVSDCYFGISNIH